MRQRLHVLYQGWPAVQSALGQPPRRCLGLGSPVLEPVHDGAGLASHEGFSRGNHQQADPVHACPPPLPEGRSNKVRHGGMRHDDGLRRADETGCRDRAVEHQMRGLRHQNLVLGADRFSLCAVADDDGVPARRYGR